MGTKSAALALAIGVCMASPNLARAQGAKRVAVLSVTGPQGPRARSIVLSAVGNNAEAVPDGEVDDAKRQVGSLSTDADIVNFATLVAADALVEGSIRRERRRWVLVLAVRSGDSGSVVGRAVFPMRNLGGLAGVGGAVWGRIGEYVQASNRPAGAGSGGTGVAVAAVGSGGGGWGAAQGGGQQSWTPSAAVGGGQQTYGMSGAGTGSGAGAGPGTGTGSGTGTGTGSGAGTGNGAGTGTGMEASAAATFPPEGAGESPTPTEPVLTEIYPTETPEESGPTSAAVWFDLAGDVSFISRDFQLPVGDEPRPRTYQGGGPEFGLALRAYPLAMAGIRGMVSRTHLYGIYRRHLSLETRGVSETGDDVTAATGESQFEIGLALPFVFGDSAQAPSIGPYVGYGTFEFSLDRKDMLEFEEPSRLSTMQYGYVVVGGQLHVGLAPPYLAASLGGGYRSVLGVGTEAMDAFGPDTAGGSGFVLGGSLSGEMPFVVQGLYWALQAEYFTFSAEFEGTEPDYGEGGLSEDAYFRAGGALGFRFEG